MYRLTDSQTDRIRFDEHVARFTREAFETLDEIIKVDQDLTDGNREYFMEGLEVDDREEAIARFDDVFGATWNEEYANQIEQIQQALDLSDDELNSLYVACPVGGYLGTDVAEGIIKRFNLLNDEPIGRQLHEIGILTRTQGKWFDDI